MATKSIVPHLVDKKEGSYDAIAPKLELGKLNKWKKHFQENFDDEEDERSSEEYLRDLDIEFHKRPFWKIQNGHFTKECLSKMSEPSYKSPVTGYSSVSKGFQPKFTPKLIQSSRFSSSQAKPKIQKDYKAEYKKMKAKLALLKASPSTSQNPKTFQPKKKGKNHARNGEWIDITMRKVNILLSMNEDADCQNYLKCINIDLKDELLILKQAKLDAVTFQIQNTELTKLNHALQEQLKDKKKINEKWLTSSKKGALPSSEVISLTFQPHTLKERYGLGIMKHTKPEIQDSSNKSVTGTVTVSETEPTTPSVPTEGFKKRGNSEDAETKLVQMLIDEKILKAKAKSFPLCTHYGHNCVIHIRGGVLAESSQSNESSIGVKCNTCRSTVHSTADHNEFDYFKRGMLTRSMATKLTAASTSKCLFADFLSKIEPKKVFEVLKHPGWVDTMQEELNQFYRNKVWTLVPLLYGKIAIDSKWVFRNKKDKHDITTKNKARLVTQGYSQEEGIEYDETFAPMARMEAIRIFLAFATYMNFRVFQMDVKSVFLNGKLKEEVYVKQPPGFKSIKFPNYIYKLDKALYGLKQSPKSWYETLSTFLIRNKFAKGRIDNTLLIYKSKRDVLLVQSNPKESHLTVVKRILKYLKGTPTLDMYYPKCLGFDLKGYSNSDYAGCNMDRKSTAGACQILNGKLVCWSAKKQQSVAMSSTKAEYVVDAGCCTSILWIKSQLNDYDIHYKMVPIFCDNTSDISISNNPVLHLITRHIDIRYLMNCPLAEAFTKAPSVLYQNLLREFWCTNVATHPNPPTDDSE
ncbi:retrovirus-related pol polyprotein from transposon TNT 1-94, partial [Tanacetum coccineum]